MFNNLISYVKDNEYLISFFDGNIHLYNYLNILTLTNKLIEIKFKNNIVIIKGSSFYIKELDKKEILISGEVKEVIFR